MFKRTIERWEEQGSEEVKGPGLAYDPQVFEFPDIIVEPRVSYMSELLRQVAHVSKRVVAIVDEGFLP
jgi:hypothetical protein